MNDLREIIKKYEFNVRGYKELKNIRIIDTDKGKFVIKARGNYDDNVYEYLTNKNFNYILERENIDNYELYPYVEELNLPKEEKAVELVYILSLLHNKTTFYKEVILDKVKEIYETLSTEIDYLNYYYHDIQDIIEQKVYMSPGEYLLIRNISLVYLSLDYAKLNLNKWYEYKKNQKKERVVLLHNKPSLDHFLVGKNRQLISWNNYRRDIPVYDFIYFYKKEYLDLEMSTLFEIYQSKFEYTEDELLLFFTIISIPKKIVFTKNNYNDCYEVFKFIKYIEKTRTLILKEDQEAEKTNYDEFNK